jgi:putative integral membrane protein (TIGR02587 family)
MGRCWWWEPTFSWRDDVVDALVALAVGFICSIAVLLLLGVLERELSWRDAIGKVSLQAVPGSMGALLAQTTLGERRAEQTTRGGAGAYASEIFVMAVGAVFLAFNLAPTDEIVQVAVRISSAKAILLMLASLALMHAFVYSLAFRGQHDAGGASASSLFLRFTVVGYAVALLLSAYMLWSFGRLDGLSLLAALKSTMVLGLPAALGAASARLML